MREQFTETLKLAMKSGDKRGVATIRMIQATLKDKDIEARPPTRAFRTRTFSPCCKKW